MKTLFTKLPLEIILLILKHASNDDLLRIVVACCSKSTTLWREGCIEHLWGKKVYVIQIHGYKLTADIFLKRLVIYGV